MDIKLCQTTNLTILRILRVLSAENPLVSLLRRFVLIVFVVFAF